MNDVLAAEIMTMANQEMRATAHSMSGMRFGGRVSAHEDRHLEKMRDIFAAYGWPTPALVGEKASYDAFSIVMHLGDKELQEQAYELLKDATRKDSNPVLVECFKKLALHLHR